MSIILPHILAVGMRLLQQDRATPEGGVGTEGVAWEGVPLHHHENETKKIKVAHIPAAGMHMLQQNQATPEGGVGTDGVAWGVCRCITTKMKLKKLK
jgi:hypothetical protein